MSIQTTTPAIVTETKELQVKYTDFNIAKLSSSSPVPKTINKKNGQQINYKDVPLFYNYGTEEGPIIDDIKIEFGKVTCPGGIRVTDNDDGTKKYAVMFVFNPSDETDNLMVKCADGFFTASCMAMSKYKGPLGCFDFDPERPGQFYKNPVYRSRDKTTGELIEGSKVSMFVKLIKSGFGFTAKQSLFTDTSGKPIDWKYLIGTDLEIIPLVLVDRIYYGNKPSLQVKLLSCIVVKAVRPNSESTQKDTLAQLKQQDPNIATQLAAQLAKLKAAYDNDGDDEAEAETSNNGPITVPSAPTTGMQAITPQQPPAKTETSSLNDFMRQQPAAQAVQLDIQPAATAAPVVQAQTYQPAAAPVAQTYQPAAEATANPQIVATYQ